MRRRSATTILRAVDQQDRVFADVVRDEVQTAVGECGDVGALNCVFAVRTWQRGYAQGARALLWAGSWSGARSVLLLEEGRA